MLWRARAALAAGQVAVAATDLQTFGREIGHQQIEISTQRACWPVCWPTAGRLMWHWR